MSAHRPLRDCPVCGGRLATTRLSCDSCDSELSGHFITCEFCALDGSDRAILSTFLRSRGNMKALERDLGVSYPTARSRLDGVLAKLGLHPDEPDPAAETLQALARGEIDIEEADRRLR